MILLIRCQAFYTIQEEWVGSIEVWEGDKGWSTHAARLSIEETWGNTHTQTHSHYKYIHSFRLSLLITQYQILSFTHKSQERITSLCI